MPVLVLKISLPNWNVWLTRLPVIVSPPVGRPSGLFWNPSAAQAFSIRPQITCAPVVADQ